MLFDYYGKKQTKEGKSESMAIVQLTTLDRGKCRVRNCDLEPR